MAKMRFLISNVSAGEITLGRRQHVARELRVERGLAYTAPLSNSSPISHSGGRLETLRVLIRVLMKNLDTLLTSIAVGRNYKLLDSGGETVWNTTIHKMAVSGTGCVEGR